MAMIQYCDQCGTRIPRDDFDAGKAVESNGRAYCKLHVPTGLAAQVQTSGTSRIPSGRVTRAGTSRRHGLVSDRGDRVSASSPPPSNSPSRMVPVISAVGCGTMALGLVVGMVVGNSGPGANPSGASGSSGGDGGGGDEHRKPPTDPAAERAKQQFLDGMLVMQHALDDFRTARDLPTSVRTQSARVAWIRCQELRDSRGAAADRAGIDRLYDAWSVEYATLLTEQIAARTAELAGSYKVQDAADYVHQVASGRDAMAFPPELCRETIPAWTRLRELDVATARTAEQWRQTEATMNRAESLRKDGKLPEAVQLYTEVLQRAPDRYDAMVMRAWCNRRLGEPGLALADLDRAVELGSGYSVAWFIRGYTRQQQNDKQGAYDDYTRAVETQPGNAMAWNNRGNINLRLDRKDDAIADFTRSMEADPKMAHPWFNRGALHQQEGRIDSAESDYRECLARDPGYLGALVNLGVIVRDRGETDDAMRHFLAATRADASAWEPCWLLAQMLVDTDKARAVDYARRALRTCDVRARSAEIDAFIRKHSGG